MKKIWVIFVFLIITTHVAAKSRVDFLNEVKNFLTQDWSQEELICAATRYNEHNFLQVYPNHTNLEYREREQAAFVLLLEGEISDPVYKIVAHGMFPKRNQNIVLLDTGFNYFYQTPPLDYDGENHFVAQARIVYAQQVQMTHDYIKKLNPHISKENMLIKLLGEKLSMNYVVIDEIELALNVLPAENMSPVAEIAASVMEGYAPLYVDFSGENSYDNDGNITQYRWNFGDNSAEEIGALVDHVFASSNTFEVKLTVVDNQGATGEKVLQINVKADNQLPEIYPEIENGAKVITDTPIFIFHLNDHESGIDQATGRMFVDNEEVTEKVVFTSERATIQFTSDWPLPAGFHNIEIRINDRFGNQKIVSVNYEVDLGEIDQGFLTGKVIDQDGNPIEDASVTQSKGPVGVRLKGMTDINGNFTIPFEASGDFIIKVSKSGYLDVVKYIELTVERDSDIGIYILTQSDPVVTHLTDQEGGSATNSTGTINFTVAPGALPFDIDFRGTEYVQNETLPAQLPELSMFTYAFDLWPQGITLNGSSELFLENSLGFPLGAELVYGVYDESLGRWVDSGHNTFVTENAKMKETALGPLPVNPFTPVDINQPGMCTNCVPPRNGPPSPSNPPPNPPNCSPDAQCCFAGNGGNSGPNVISGCSIDMYTGNLEVDYSLPSIKRFEEDISLKFSYNSTTVYPTLFVGNSLINQIPDPADSVGYKLRIAGRTIDATFNGDAIVEKSLFRTLIVGKNAEGKFLESGSYDYEVDFKTRYNNSFYATATYFGAPANAMFSPQVLSRVPLDFRADLKNRVALLNHRQSPFGAGWTLNGLERLHFSPNSVIVWENGKRAAAAQFVPITTSGTGKYSKINLQQQLAKKGITSEAGIVNLVARFGYIYAADCVGNMVYRIDATGNVEVIAGTGERGFSGDGGLATKARLDCPKGVYPAELGGVYIADSGNFRIRKIQKDGTIITIAGNGTGTEGEDNQEANKVGIGRPQSVSEDKMFAVYFTVGDKIRFINPRGRLETYSGPGVGYVEANLKRPSQVFFDKFDYPIVVDKNNSRLIAVYPQAKLIKPLLEKDNSPKANADEIVVQRPVSVSIDTKLKRFFILEESGRILHWGGPGQNRLVEIEVTNSSLRPSIKNKRAEDLKFNAKAMTYSNETGLVISDGQDIIMSVATNNSQKGLAASKNDGEIFYISQEGDYSTLKKNADGTYERTTADETLVKFNILGQMISRYNPLSKTTFYAYDSQNRLSQIILPSSDYYEFTYSGSGYLESVTDPAGRSTHFEIDPDGNLLAIDFPDESSKQFSYNEDHMITSETDESNLTTMYELNHGKIVKETLPGNRERFIQPSFLSKLIPIDVKLDNDKNYVLKDLEVVNPEDVILFADSKGGDCRSTMLANDKGVVTNMTNCQGDTTTYEVDSKGFVTDTVTPEDRRIYSYAFDSLGRKILQDGPDGRLNYTYYGDTKRIHTSTYAGNPPTSFIYNEQGLVSNIIDPLGYQSSYVYNSFGKPTQIQDALGNIYAFEYGETGNLEKSIDPLLQTVEYIRDDAGNVTKVKDQLSRITSFVFGPSNRLLEISDPLNQKTSFDYNNAGQLLSLTDPKNQKTSFEYGNYLGKVSKIINPTGQEELFSYDINERITEKINKDGTGIVYNYNLIGNLLSKVTLMNTVSYQYDKDGYITTVSDNDSQMEYQYNSRGKVQEVKQTHLDNGSIVYGYNTNNQKSSMRYINNSGVEKINIQYQYTQRNQVARIDASLFGKTFVWEASYDELGRMVYERLNGKLLTTYGWDELSRMTAVLNEYDSRIISGQNYTYSPSGNIVEKNIIIGGRDDQSGIRTESFSYDLLDRVVNSSREKEFAYDEVGNRINHGEVFNNLNQLLENNDYDFSYTVNGNVETKRNKKNNELFEYTWDNENQLIQVKQKKNVTELIKTIDYKLDGSGRRIEKTVTNTQNLSYSRQYFYDQEDILLEFDQDNQIIAAYFHGPGIDRPLAMLRDNNKNGNLDANEIFYYTRDNLGSIRDLLNYQGKLVQRYTYGVYGVTRIEKDNPEDDQKFVENPYAFTGREWDQETGDYYYRARYYNPETGRFLSEDPIGFEGGDSNFYRYVKNQPIIKKDATGNGPIACGFVMGLYWSDLDKATEQWNGALVYLDQAISKVRDAKNKYSNVNICPDPKVIESYNSKITKLQNMKSELTNEYDVTLAALLASYTILFDMCIVSPI